MLKGYFRLDNRDALPTVSEKVTTTLRGLNDALTPTVPAFLALLDVPVDDPQWQAFAAPQRRQRTLDALKRILLRESQVKPLLLVVENLHWIDTGTQAVLDTLIDSLPAARLFLLTTYRPEHQHGWGNKTYYTQLRLDSLAHESAQALLDSLLGIDAALEPLKRRLIERAQGNPFFLEESVLTLVETQALDGAQGAFHLAKALQSIQVSSTVQAVLAARIDRLPPEEKHLLQTAAVVGTEVPVLLLQRLAGLPEDVLQRGLSYLQGGEFLYETHVFPEPAHTFKHALTREVAYGSLLHERKRALHARIVEALEALAPERVAEQVERLAYHALRGEVWDKAVVYCRQAGERAQNRGAFREAVAYYEQALDALGRLPERPDTEVLGIELRRRLGGMLSLVGEQQRSLAVLGEAAARARQLNDRARLGEVLARMVTVRRIVGDFDSAMAAGREALQLAATPGDPVLHVHAAYRLGQAYASIGDYRRAAEVLRGNVAALERSTPGYMRLRCISSQARLAEMLGLLGEFAEGRCHGEEALRLARVDGQWLTGALITACERLGHLYLAQGDLEAAIRVFKEGLSLCRDSGLKVSFGSIAGGLGEAYVQTGRLAEGLSLLEEARSHDLRTGALGGDYVTHLRQLSAIYLLNGRIDEAWQHACQALDLARRQKGAWKRGVGTVPAGCGPRPDQPPRCPAGRGALPGSTDAGRGAGHAATPGPLPSWPWHPIREDRSAGTGPRRAVHRHRPLPCHGDDLLATPGRGSAGANQRMRAPGQGVP